MSGSGKLESATDPKNLMLRSIQFWRIISKKTVTGEIIRNIENGKGETGMGYRANLGCFTFIRGQSWAVADSKNRLFYERLSREPLRMAKRIRLGPPFSGRYQRQ